MRFISATGGSWTGDIAGRPRRLSGRGLIGSLVVPLVLFWAQFGHTADVVVVNSTRPGQPPVQRQGEIVDLAGNQLVFRTPSGVNETIALQQVASWRTTWPAAKEQADALFLEKKYTEAAALYVRAREEEQRPWARRQIIGRLVEVHGATGNLAAAADEFLILVTSDPETSFWEIAPLGWRSTDDANLHARAVQWIRDTRTPARQLMGASWLLAGAQRAEALATLQSLANGPNKRIASLAALQLWRTRIVTSTPDEPPRWLAAVERLPTEVRPIGYFCIGEAFARHNQPAEAALAYLRIPILYAGNRPLSAEALLAAAAQLEKMGRREQAAGLYREVITDHALLPAAQFAQQHLQRLAAPPMP
jgi:tetratricopeptide (TPR) repeat protein